MLWGEAEAEDCAGCLRKRWLENSGGFIKAKMNPEAQDLGFQFCQGWDLQNRNKNLTKIRRAQEGRMLWVVYGVITSPQSSGSLSE